MAGPGPRLAAGVLVGVGLLWAADARPWGRPLTAPPIGVHAAYHDFVDTLRRDETLRHVLTRRGIAGADYERLLAAAGALDLRRLGAGLPVHFRRLHTDSIPLQVMVRPASDRRVWLRRSGGDSGWVQTEELIAWSARVFRISGVIESSLYDALDRSAADSLLPAGQRRALAWAIADVYQWEVDFTRDVRPGDRFAVVFERLESPEGERRLGRVVAARMDVARAPAYAFWFDGDGDGDGAGGYYDERGRSLRRAFLRTPLAFRRISGGFGGRYHPILKRWRGHDGTDYAAAFGTPVRATAEGTVTRASPHAGYGNLVELRHANGIRTRYGHLSRFGAGVRVGTRVRQAQVIGYVGSTGLSTGPHLHYEFLVNGRPTNPRRRDAGSGRPVPAAQRVAYEAVRERLLPYVHPRAGADAPGSPRPTVVD